MPTRSVYSLLPSLRRSILQLLQISNSFPLTAHGFQQKKTRYCWSSIVDGDSLLELTASSPKSTILDQEWAVVVVCVKHD